MMSFHRFAIVALALAISTALLAKQTAPTAQHLDARGKHVMGFDQQTTTHHFRLYEDGGAIEVGVKDKADAENLTAIRGHLPHISKLFGDGEFEAPMHVHNAGDIPGVADLARLKSKLTYTFVETPTGGRVDIVTTDKEALNALHAFLRFQITDHQTGDPVTVAKRVR
jgi:hypothetical protein